MADLKQGKTLRFRSSNFYDQPILETANYAVVPSLGSFVEGWTLVVPKAPTVNLQAVPEPLRVEFRDLVQLVRSEIERAYGETSLLEHGPAVAGSLMGCGADQAHLHIVPFVFAELPEVEGTWSLAHGPMPFDAPKVEGDYLWLAANGTAHICRPEVVTSQFFRQRIADRLGVSSSWDYKLQPHHDTVRATSERLSAALNA